MGKESFPRLYAAASLKHDQHESGAVVVLGFPRLYAAASLKLPVRWVHAGEVQAGFSAALCRGLIEAHARRHQRRRRGEGFPRLYAAASLKQDVHPVPAHQVVGFPRLYAAASLKQSLKKRAGDALWGFPRLYAAASLKLARVDAVAHLDQGVFRGFMPRPH